MSEAPADPDVEGPGRLATLAIPPYGRVAMRSFPSTLHRRPVTLLAGVGVIVAVSAPLLRGARDSTLGSRVPNGTSRQSLLVDGRRRTYVLHVPDLAPRESVPSRLVPLVVLLHGSGADGNDIRELTRMDSLAEADQFVVAYPNGSAGWLSDLTDWNAGFCCGPAQEHRVDDVGFVHALVGDLALHLPIDRHRVYVAGFSDGARMSFRIGCELSREVAAIGAVSGSLTVPRCKPDRPVPLVAFHGTADESVPYDDSVSASVAPRASYSDARGGALAKLPPAVRFWAASNGCVTPSSAPVSTRVTRTTFGRCVADVVFYAVQDGQHEWPSGASEALAGFFLAH